MLEGFKGLLGSHVFNSDENTIPLDLSVTNLLIPFNPNIAERLSKLGDIPDEIEDFITPKLPEKDILRISEKLNGLQIPREYWNDLIFLSFLPKFIDETTRWIASWVNTPEDLIQLRELIQLGGIENMIAPILKLSSAKNSNALNTKDPDIVKRFFSGFKFSESEIKKFELFDAFSQAKLQILENEDQEEKSLSDINKDFDEIKKLFLHHDRAKDVASYIAAYVQYHKIYEPEPKLFKSKIITLINILFNESEVFTGDEKRDSNDVRARINNYLKPERSFFYKES